MQDMQGVFDYLTAIQNGIYGIIARNDFTPAGKRIDLDVVINKNTSSTPEFQHFYRIDELAIHFALASQFHRIKAGIALAINIGHDIFPSHIGSF